MDTAAHGAVARLVALVLADSGFEAADGQAACWLQELTIELIGGLAQLAELKAIGSRRTRATARDVIAAVEDQSGYTQEAIDRLFYGNTGVQQTRISAFDLLRLARDNMARHCSSGERAHLTTTADTLERLSTVEREPPRPTAPQIPIVPSRTASDAAPNRLPIQPKHFPLLPPEHVYKQTAVYKSLNEPTNALERFEDRRNTDRLVQLALRNLVRATTDPKLATAGKPRLKLFIGGGTGRGADDTAVVSWETAGSLSLSSSVLGTDSSKQRVRWR